MYLGKKDDAAEMIRLYRVPDDIAADACTSDCVLADMGVCACTDLETQRFGDCVT